MGVWVVTCCCGLYWQLSLVLNWRWHAGAVPSAGWSAREAATGRRSPGRPHVHAPTCCLPPCPQASLEDLNRQLAFAGEAELPMNRFRPNLVVRGARAWAEDGWRRLAVGAGAGDVEFEK